MTVSPDVAGPPTKVEPPIRMLVVQSSLDPPGGSNCVAAWLLEALRGRYALTVLLWRAPDLKRVNRFYGTSLRPGDFEIRRIPRAQQRLFRLAPTPMAHLRISVTTRYARHLLRREAFDVVLSCDGEMDFGQPGIQYVNFPFHYLPRPVCDNRWYHHLFPPAVTAYWRFCAWIGQSSQDGIRRNLSLANSDWTGRKFRELYGTGALTLYPPVPGEFHQRPWADREDGFVCIGRISQEKNLETVISILTDLRQRGHTLRLHLVGSPDSPSYTRKILALADARSWVDVHFDLPRAELLELMAANRYGIHGMVGEHFGIAPAELQRAGAIVFVPSEGGPTEIVDHDPHVIYDSPEEAVEKIDRILTDGELRAAVRAGVQARKDRFSAERFMAEIRAAVEGFECP